MVDDTPLMGDEEAGGSNNKPAGGGEGGGVAMAGVTLDAAQLPLFLVFVAGVILLIATGAEYKWLFYTSYRGYALSVSAIAMVLSAFGLALTRTPNDVYGKAGAPLNMLIFSYGFIGACFLTFNGPFTTTSNGYFASWAIVYGSGLAIGMSSLQSGGKGLGSAMGLMASSLIVIVATINPIRHGINRNEAIFALVLACVTFVFFVVAAKKGGALGGAEAGTEAATGYFLVLALLAMCWIVEASLVTFRGPFTATGNGYFASWTGAFTACIAAFAAMKSL
ncbi:hypothetical protein ACHAWF_018032 [Thalassiosira exigua]